MVVSLSIFNSDTMLKKIILNIALVALIVFVLDFAIGKTLRHFYFKETSGLHYRTTYSMEQTKAEVLIFGASRANHHYVPEIFENSLKLTTYNTGRDANGIFYETALLKSVLKRYSPKIIILDYPGDFSFNRKAYDNLSSLFPYYKTHKEIRRDVELRSPFERIELLSELYTFNSQILTIAKGNLETNKKRNADSKGYVPLQTDSPPEFMVFSSHKSYDVDSKKVKSTQEFLIRAKEAGARVYVIYSPLFWKVARNQDAEICKSICAEENVPFWNFSQDPFFLSRQDLFYDNTHLNQKGSKIFSLLVSHKIRMENQ
jgi:hypothetical protein